MIANQKKVNTNQIELSIELDNNELNAFVDKTEVQLGRELEIDGFRKGKVPKELVRKHVDSKTILNSALDMAVRDSLADVIKKEEWDVLNVSKMNVKENSAQKLKFSVLLTLFPDIKISDFNFKIKKRNIAIEQKEVDEALENIRVSRAKFVPKDGLAENGDRVELNFEIKIDGKVVEGGTSKNHPLILGKKGFIPGFEDNVIGMALHQNKHFSVVAPDNYFHKEIAGKKLDIDVEVLDIKKVELPEMGTDFIKSLGRFEDTGQLMDSIKDGLTEEKKEKEKQRVRLEILNTIVSKSDITAPESMVEEQLEKMVNDFDNDLHRSGMELGPYLAHLDKTADDLKKDWENEAIKQVKIMLVVHKIAREQNITATQEELEMAMNDSIQQVMLGGDIQKGNIDIQKIRDAIATQMINEKTLKFLEERYCI